MRKPYGIPCSGRWVLGGAEARAGTCFEVRAAGMLRGQKGSASSGDDSRPGLGLGPVLLLALALVLVLVLALVPLLVLGPVSGLA
jgi:hypothetical protein